MVVCSSKFIVVDPAGRNLAWPVAPNIQLTEPWMSTVRGFTRRLGYAGHPDLYDFRLTGALLEETDPDATRMTWGKLQAIIREKEAIKAETVLYMLGFEFEEYGATRSRQIVPYPGSPPDPNPHLIEQTDQGDGTYFWRYYPVVQGRITATGVKRTPGFDWEVEFEFVETVVRTPDLE